MSLADLLTAALVTGGLFFFVAGSVGVVRFPDTHTRLHALTKADNLGLGLIVLGLLFQVDGVWTGARIVLVYVLAVIAAGTSAQLLARAALIEERRRTGDEDRP